MENNNGEYMDKHIGDDVPEEMREGIVKDVMERLAARGLSSLVTLRLLLTNFVRNVKAYASLRLKRRF